MSEAARGWARNLTLYPYLRAGSDAIAWTAVFVLYMSQYLSLSEVLALEALYYLAVVVLEVPSGYLADRLGRRVTLMAAQLLFISAYALFLLGDDFAIFACAQVCLAAGIAAMSGADVALHYDSALALGAEDEFGDREGRAKRVSLLAGAVAVLAGGALASVALEAAYWISMAGAACAFLIAGRMVEPPRADALEPDDFATAVATCVRLAGSAPLRWLFAYVVVAYVLAHVPYELYQPYLAELARRGELMSLKAPLVSGFLLAATMLCAAWVAGRAMSWRKRFGITPVLAVAVALELVIIAAMALALHPALVAVMLLRSTPMAMAHAPVHAAIAPHVPSRQRATYLSVESLAGRLAFSVSLALVAAATANSPPGWTALSQMLSLFLIPGVLAALALFIWRGLRASA